MLTRLLTPTADMAEDAPRRAALKRLRANAAYAQSSKMDGQRQQRGEATPGLAAFKELARCGDLLESAVKRELWASVAGRVAAKKMAQFAELTKKNASRQASRTGAKKRAAVGLEGASPSPRLPAAEMLLNCS